MPTVRRVQYGVPGAGSSDDPAAGAARPRVTVTEESDEMAKRFDRLLEADPEQQAQRAAALDRQAREARQADRDRTETERAEPDAAGEEKEPAGGTERRDRTEEARDPALAEAAKNRETAAEQSAEDGPAASDEEADPDLDASDPDDDSSDAPVAGSTDESARHHGTGTAGSSPAGGPLDRPVEAAGRTDEHHRRHGDGSGIDDDEAAVAAAATLMQPQAAPPVATVEAPPDEVAPVPAAPEVAEIARQVATRLAVQQPNAGGSARIRIQLKDDVLPRTALTVSREGDGVVVTVTTGSADLAAVIEGHAQALAAAIAERTGDHAVVRYRDGSGAACEASAAGPAVS